MQLSTAPSQVSQVGYEPGWQRQGGCHSIHGQRRGRDQLAQTGSAPGPSAKDRAPAPGVSFPLAGRQGQSLPGPGSERPLCPCAAGREPAERSSCLGQSCPIPASRRPPAEHPAQPSRLPCEVMLGRVVLRQWERGGGQQPEEPSCAEGRGASDWERALKGRGTWPCLNTGAGPRSRPFAPLPRWGSR